MRFRAFYLPKTESWEALWQRVVELSWDGAKERRGDTFLRAELPEEGPAVGGLKTRLGGLSGQREEGNKAAKAGREGAGL